MQRLKRINKNILRLSNRQTSNKINKRECRVEFVRSPLALSTISDCSLFAPASSARAHASATTAANARLLGSTRSFALVLVDHMTTRVARRYAFSSSLATTRRQRARARARALALRRLPRCGGDSRAAHALALLFATHMHFSSSPHTLSAARFSPSSLSS